MKKLLLSLVTIFAVSFATHAQTNFGLTAGLNGSNFSGKDSNNTSMKLGFNVGALAEFEVSENIFIQPEIKYSEQGTKTTTFLNAQPIDASFLLNYVQIPVKVKYKPTENIGLFLAPQIGFNTTAKVKTETFTYQGQTIPSSEQDVKESFNSTDFGLLLGGEYVSDMGLGAGLGYNIGLSSLENEGEANVFNSVLNLNVIYLFN